MANKNIAYSNTVKITGSPVKFLDLNKFRAGASRTLETKYGILPFITASDFKEGSINPNATSLGVTIEILGDIAKDVTLADNNDGTTTGDGADKVRRSSVAVEEKMYKVSTCSPVRTYHTSIIRDIDFEAAGAKNKTARTINEYNMATTRLARYEIYSKMLSDAKEAKDYLPGAVDGTAAKAASTATTIDALCSEIKSGLSYVGIKIPKARISERNAQLKIIDAAVIAMANKGVINDPLHPSFKDGIPEDQIFYVTTTENMRAISNTDRITIYKMDVTKNISIDVYKVGKLNIIVDDRIQKLDGGKLLGMFVYLKAWGYVPKKVKGMEFAGRISTGMARSVVVEDNDGNAVTENISSIDALLEHGTNWYLPKYYNGTTIAIRHI